MSTKKIILPRLNDCGGEIHRQWFVYYSFLDPRTGQMKRFKLYNGFASLRTPADRYDHAEKMLDEYRRKLLSGWSPFEKRDAVIYEDEIMYAPQAAIMGRRMTSMNPLRSYLSEYLADQRYRIAPKTYESYQSKTRLFCQWLEAREYDRDLPLIDRKIIIQFFNFLIEHRKLSKRTIEKYQQNLTTLFDYLLKRKLIPENPVQDIPRIGLIVDYAPKPIKMVDVAKLKGAILKKDPQLWLACLFQFYCFIRPGTELRLLKVFNIDFDAALITVQNTLSKNRRTETVQIPNSFMKILLEVYQLNTYSSDLYVFGREGCPGTEPMGKNTMRVKFNKFRDSLNMSKEYKFYSWKHTGASAAVDAGIPERHLMDQLRHKSFETTNYYFRRHKGYKSPDIQEKFPEI